MSNPNGVAPADFLSKLYGEVDVEKLEYEVEAVFVKEEHLSSVDDDEIVLVPSKRCSSPDAPPYSPLSPPKRRRVHTVGSEDRDRSPSPILTRYPSSKPIVLRIYDETGTPLEDLVDNLDTYMSPDAHNLYGRVEGTENVTERGAIADRNPSLSCSLRGRTRSGRRGRPVHSRGGGRRQGTCLLAGHPLEEIWVNDDDVPPELREMATEVVKRRMASTTLKTGEDEDVYYDAVDGRGNPLLADDDLRFEWFPMGTFQGEEGPFRPKRTGSVISYSNPYDAFRSFWDDNILQVIVDKTNWYASKISSPSFQSEWYPTNSHELLCLFAFWMMLGIIPMPTIRSCFSQNSLLKTEVFTRITTLKRYNSLNRALHFVGSGTESTDLAFRLRPIIDHLNLKFQSNYVLSKDICIDESLTLWKGRLNFKQYIRSKAAKFGIKTFELCESATGYLWSFLVYTGKNNSFGLDSRLSISTAIVCELIKPLLNKGHRLFMDNWFNSPFLARFLKRNGTDCVGTLRPNRQNVPKLVTQAPLKQGQFIARHSGDVCILSWQDKKRVNMITTCHGSGIGLSSVASHPPTRPLPFKPQVVLDYNRSMGGVDLKDQMLEPYLLERKRGAKWYKKLFKRLLNCSIHNARILLESSLKSRQNNLEFRLELVDSILSQHHALVPLGRRKEALRQRTSPNFTSNTHWPVKVQASGYDIAHNRQGRQRCVVCTKSGRKTQKTAFKCEDCDVPLCVQNCFKSYHTTVS